MEVHVETAVLDDGNPIVYRDFGRRVRLAYDPRQINQGEALDLLTHFLPECAGAEVIHRAGA